MFFSLSLKISTASKNDLEYCCERFLEDLKNLNEQKKIEIDGHFAAAVGNIISAVRYERLDPNGPKIKVVSAEHPLVTQ